MLHRASRVAGLQVVDRVVREQPVLEVQRACPHLVGGLAEPGLRQHQARGQPGYGEHQGSRRHQPSSPAAPEIEQRDLARPLVPAPQMPRDQEPGDHEEDVHANEPARQQRRVEVVDQHHGHGDRPQPLDVRPEVAVGLAVLGGFPDGRRPYQPVHVRQAYRDGTELARMGVICGLRLNVPVTSRIPQPTAAVAAATWQSSNASVDRADAAGNRFYQPGLVLPFCLMTKNPYFLGIISACAFLAGASVQQRADRRPHGASLACALGPDQRGQPHDYRRRPPFGVLGIGYIMDADNSTRPSCSNTRCIS